MKKQGQCIFGIREVGICVGKIFSKENDNSIASYPIAYAEIKV